MFEELSSLIDDMLSSLSLREERLRRALTTLSVLWVKRRVLPPRGSRLRAKLYHLIGDSLKLFEVIKGFLPNVDQVIDVGTGVGVPGIPLALAMEHLYAGETPQIVLADRSSRGLKVCAATLRAMREEGFLRRVKILVLRAEVSELPQLLGSARRLWLARAVAKPPLIFQLLSDVASAGDVFAWQYSARWQRWRQDISSSGWKLINVHEYRLALGEPRAVITLTKLGGEADEYDEYPA